MIPAIGESTLIGHTATFVGFGFATHPEKSGQLMLVSVYGVNGKVVLCLTDELSVDAKGKRLALGETYPAEMLMRTAARLIHATLDNQLRQTIEVGFRESMRDMVFHWAR